MFENIAVFTLFVMSILSFCALISVVKEEFRVSGRNLLDWEKAVLMLPCISAVATLWRIVELRGGGLIRFELLTFCFAWILLLTFQWWGTNLAQAWSEVRDDKQSARASVVVILITIAGFYLLVEAGWLIKGLIELVQRNWAEVPKSTQWFYYGLGVVGITVLMIFGMAALSQDNPESGIVVTKFLVSMLVCLWAFCWGVSVIYSVIEKFQGAL